MSTVIEYTMFVKPEAFDEVMKAYVEFADAFGVENPSEDLILVTGDRDGGVVRGIGIFEDDMEAEIAVDESIFVRFRERIAPHLTEEPIREALRPRAHLRQGLDPRIVSQVTVLQSPGAQWRTRRAGDAVRRLTCAVTAGRIVLIAFLAIVLALGVVGVANVLGSRAQADALQTSLDPSTHLPTRSPPIRAR